MDIGPDANGLCVRIGMPLDEHELGPARIAKAGFFMRSYLRKTKQPGDVLYWAKNPDLRFFGGKVIANPAQSNRAAGLFRSGRPGETDLIFGTSIFLYFNGGRLRLVEAQVVKSFVWAKGFTNEFREVAVNTFGDASWSDPSTVSAFILTKSDGVMERQIHLRCSWNNDDEFLISGLTPKGDTGYVFWGQVK